ncbi:MAG: 3-phosphoshikimate 1-carboxyvinyltransferase [Gemmatimonadota bacterium]|nr:3-phosphoshikimate 1-carboxyvinyltransferase [Gemmatimonadota bacterium]
MGFGDGLTIRVPGDKSITQRALILGAMADGESRIGAAPRGADPLATALALRALGVRIDGLDEPATTPLRIGGAGLRGWQQPRSPLDLRNSGTGARLLAGALAAQPFSAILSGDESLSRRPMERIAVPLRRMGAAVEYLERRGVLPMRVAGGALRSICHDGSVASAQVKSAILLAAVGGGVPVEVREPRRSRDHSERMLEAMGAEVEEERRDGLWAVRITEPSAQLAPLEMDVPGDFSSAAFFLAWAALAEAAQPLTIRGAGLNATRTGFLPVLARMGAEVEAVVRGAAGGEPAGDLRVGAPGSGLRGVEVGGGEVVGMIDEIPVLAILAARAAGETRITGAAELRVKESDRLAALAVNLRRIGVQVEELPDGLVIEGTTRPLSGRVECFHDHRIAMAFGVLGAAPGCDIRVDDPGVADVSFPGFWRLLTRVTDAARRRPTAPGRCTVVTIDGSAGAGKSTTAAAVAARLGFRHLDSGAIYRAVTLGLMDSEDGCETVERITPRELAALALEVRWDGAAMEIRICGESVPEAALRAERVTAMVSRVSAVPAVREHLLELQRDAARPPGLVAEGRDMGTVVFPDAGVKVYLDADPRERARRRLLQGGAADPKPEEVEAEAARLAVRDRTDSSRTVAPLLMAADAHHLDTTDMEPQSQIAAIVNMAMAAEAGRQPSRRAGESD